MSFRSGQSREYQNAFAIAPDDAIDLTKPCILWIGGAGALKVITIGGDTVTLAAVPAGTQLNLRVTRVFNTGTAATAIIGLY